MTRENEWTNAPKLTCTLSPFSCGYILDLIGRGRKTIVLVRCVDFRQIKELQLHPVLCERQLAGSAGASQRNREAFSVQQVKAPYFGYQFLSPSTPNKHAPHCPMLSAVATLGQTWARGTWGL